MTDGANRREAGRTVREVMGEGAWAALPKEARSWIEVLEGALGKVNRERVRLRNLVCLATVNLERADRLGPELDDLLGQLHELDWLEQWRQGAVYQQFVQQG